MPSRQCPNTHRRHRRHGPHWDLHDTGCWPGIEHQRPVLRRQRQAQRRFDVQSRRDDEARHQRVIGGRLEPQMCFRLTQRQRLHRRAAAINQCHAALPVPALPKEADRHRLHRQRSRSIRTRGGAPRTEENAKARLRQPEGAKRPAQKRAPRPAPHRLAECGPSKAAPPRRASLAPARRTGVSKS